MVKRRWCGKMGTASVVFVCAVLCGSVGADFLGEKSDRNNIERQSSGIAFDEPKGTWMSHRVQLLFPLLLRISARLATLVPTALMGLIGIFLFVAFSKKAFIISLLALFLTYLDKYRQREEDIVHIHKIKTYNDDEALTHNNVHFHHGWPHWKRYAIGRYAFPYGNWKKFNHIYPYRLPFSSYHHHYSHHPHTPPASLDGLRRTSVDLLRFTGSNRTVSTDFQQFLSESVNADSTSERYFSI